MTSSRVTSPKEEEGADWDGAERDGAEREGGAAESDCLALNYATFNGSVVYGTHDREMVERGKRNRKIA